ncbi:MAG: capsule assembly Wzi family protein [Muribaculaceae bacterium]|nr:capsule assembly Wzi family protein [Muribaculaceae bacterium]
MNKYVHAAILTLAAATARGAMPSLSYEASFEAVPGTERFAPYMAGSWRNGLMNGRTGAVLDAAVHKELDKSRRFSWAAGIEIAGGYMSASNYEMYHAGDWTERSYRPAGLVLQQAFATVKYRQVYLTAGQKNPHSYFVNERVSSGDLARSNNARGLPGVEAGFLDFVDIPFTRGWVQIDGSISYNAFTDDKYRRSQFNYYNDILATGLLYTYKRAHFRTNPSKPFSVTAGMQTGGMFGGTTQWWDRGKNTRIQKNGASLRTFFDMFLPIEGNGDGYYKGASLGTIDLKLRYRLKNGAEIAAYVQNPWEDGSGLGKFNGFDGLWGVSYHAPGRAIITDAAIEWLDFTNESGPIAWQPADYPGCTQINATSGGDNYFNNDQYGAYANYGMAIGSPFVMAPVYNTDGTPFFAHNMCKGIHIAAAGAIGRDIDWRAMYSYQKAWGMGRLPSPRSYACNSAMIEGAWNASAVLPGLSLKAMLAFDTGSLRGDNFGVYIGIKYTGLTGCKK